MTPAFTGFSPDAITFLRGLKANNDRTWFAAHKATYEAALKRPAEAFAAELSARLETMLDRAFKAKIFRINRDIRFSKDKTPYNAHLHIGFSPVSDPEGPAYLFGLEPDRMVVGAGLFEQSGARLDGLRRAIDLDGDRLAALTAGWRLHEPALKRVPAPYAADHPHAELLKHKGITLWRDMPAGDAAVGPALAGIVGQAFAELAPLNDWLADAVR